jgi:phage/plasmid-associated DNA primase
MDFVYNRDAENTAHLRSVTPNTETTVRLYNIKTDAGALAEIIARGNKDVTVNNQRSIDAARSIINTAVQHHGTTLLGDLNQIFIGTLNVYNNNVVVNSSDAGRRDDESVAMVVIDHNPEFRDRVKFVPEMKNACCNGLYFCDVDTNLWIQEANTFMERRVLGYIRSLPDSSVTTAELKHMRSRRGTSDTLYIMAREVADAGFKDRLDSNPHLFAMENCLLDTRTMTMRPFQPADYIGYTVGWSYDSDAARTHRPALESFLHQVLPVADERKVVLSFFAGSLSGVRQSKSFLALTDRRAGYNGKSALVNLMARFFGFYGEFNTRFVCAGSFQKDRDSHDAGLEPYRHTRLLVAEELKHNMNLDVALLKKLAGGSDVTVEGRRFGLGERFSFTWRANIVLVFNEGDCPRFDGDAALLQRMLVAPMRSKFVANLPGDPEEYTFIADKTIAQKFPLWLPALLDVLKEHYDPDAMDSPPLSMRQWGQNVATEANPLGSWMEERVVVTGKKEDYVQLSDVLPLYRSDDQLRRRMDEDSFKRFAKAYLKTNGLTFKEKDNVLNGNGVRTTARHAARGIKMGTQL